MKEKVNNQVLFDQVGAHPAQVCKTIAASCSVA